MDKCDDLYEDRRKFKRFQDHSLYQFNAFLQPVPPLYGEPTEGLVLDLSAGGLSLLLQQDILPKGVLYKMVLTFPKGIKVDLAVKVCHIRKFGRNNGYAHGIEFLNMPPELEAKINTMADDCGSCEERIRDHRPTICKANCSLYSICKRPQHEIGEPQAVKIKMEPVNETSSSWESFKSSFEKRMKRAA